MCVYFRNLINEKNFVSFVRSSCTNETEEITLVLQLVDTSTPEDIFIDELLIDKKMALPDTITDAA